MNNQTMSQVSTKEIPVNSIDAYKARDILGCSYPHLITLLQSKRIKAEKIGKCWYVDVTDLDRAKQEKIVTPRPRQPKENSTENSQEATIVLNVPRDKFNLLNLATMNREQKTLQQVLEAQIAEMFAKVESHLGGFTF